MSVEVTQLHPCMGGGGGRKPAAYCQSFEPWARLKFHAGWSGWTRPPAMAGGGLEACLQEGVEGVF